MHSVHARRERLDDGGPSVPPSSWGLCAALLAAGLGLLGALAALALGRRRRGRTRLVVTLHNLTVGGRLTTLVGERLERLIASRADLVLAVSPDLAERARGLGAARVELASLGATASPSRLERALERLDAAQRASRQSLSRAA